MHSLNTLYESLQREFCPPLDSSLLAALLADIIKPDLNGDQLPTQTQIDDLRSSLRELASRAEQDECHLSERLAAASDDSHSTPDLFGGDITRSSITSESSSASSSHSFSSPLGFLQAAFPHNPTEALSVALNHAEEEIGGFDMDNVVEELLTNEYLRELEERGFDEDADLQSTMGNREQLWQTVKSKPRLGESKAGGRTTKRKFNKKRTFTFGDVRQTQQARALNAALATRASAGLDPWTQLSSLSTHLATLLPPHPPSFFQSCFHSPEYTTPYLALRAKLASIRTTESNDEDGDERTSPLFDLLDILLPSFDDLDSEQRSRLIADTQLAIRVTQGRGEDALDLVKLLRELDSDSASGCLEIGVYHSRPQKSSPPLTLPEKRLSLPPITVPSTSRQDSNPPSPVKQKPDPFQWQSILQRKPPRDDTHYLAAFIPAYDNVSGGGKIRGSGNGIGKGGKGDVGEVGKAQARICQERMRESIRKRNELLREASRAWKSGSAKTRGGEVALYFAERARQVQEAARKESLEASRMMVQAKRALSQDGSVDLHGISSSEAIIIVKEILQQTGPSPQKPLNIITGRGKHSANGVGVLRPAVKNALVAEGWVVGTWDGGLVVRGKGGRAA